MKRTIFLIILFSLAIHLFFSCEKDDMEKIDVIPVDNLVLPVDPVSDSSLVQIQGSGFQDGDRIRFRLPGIGTSYVEELQAHDDYVEFFVPRHWKGNYQVILEREGNEYILGNIHVALGPHVSDIVLPENLGAPVLTIEGNGFSENDSIVFVSVNEPSKVFQVSLLDWEETGITFSVPPECVGENEVYVLRNGVEVLLGNLSFPIPPDISNIQMPEGPFDPVSYITIHAEGFEEGDEILAGPSQISLFPATGVTIDGNSVSFYIPRECVKENVVYVVRGGKTLLGTIEISTPALNTVAYGGVVFYVDEETGHGLVCSSHQFAQQFFGPNTMHSEPPTSYAYGEGPSNTRKLVEYIGDWRDEGNTWDQKTAAETVSEWSEEVEGVVYDDWFLPSNDEMLQLYLAHKNKEVDIIPRLLNYDNYQTSSESEAWRDGAVRCFNFWYIGEPVDPVVTDMAKQLPLGLLAVRKF